MLKTNIVALFAFLCAGLGFSQEGLPVYFDYLSDNYYLIHPSMAGVSEGGKIRLTARKQWFDVDRAPALQTLSAHMRVGEKSGIGAILYNDRNGYHSQTGVKLTYAHHLILSGDVRALNQLSFGMSAGLIQSNLDETEFRSIDPDNAISGTNNSVTYYNVDLGASYNFLEFYAHFTVKNLLGTNRDLYSGIEIDNLRRYLVSAGYVFGKSAWQLEPSVLFQLTEFTKEKSVDINMKAYKDTEFGTLWGGLSYRRSFDAPADLGELQLFTPILGVNLKKFMFAYTYTYQTGDLRFANGGFHQITLGYNFGQPEKRYDCKCPAINL